MPADSDAPPRRTEIAIIGGGIAGLSAGLFLARAGAEVTLLERGELWGESSGANAGTLSLQVKTISVLALARKALEIWRALGETMGIEVGFAQPGGIRVATSDALVEELARYADRQRQVGVATDWVEGASLRDFAPWLGPSVKAATVCAEDGFSSPLIAGPTLIEGVRRAGAKIVAEARVEAIERRDGDYRLALPTGSVTCKILVIAAGPSTTRLGRMLGADLPLYVDVNMLSVTEPAPPVLDRVVTHIGGILSLKQHPNGTVLIGGGWQGRGGHRSGRKDIDHERLVQNLGVATRVVPGLRRLHLVRTWAGFEAVTPDALPFLGRLPGHDNAYVTGGARGGYHLGPAQGLLLSELIRDGEASLPIEAFDPGRYAAPAARAHRTASR